MNNRLDDYFFICQKRMRSNTKINVCQHLKKKIIRKPTVKLKEGRQKPGHL